LPLGLLVRMAKRLLLLPLLLLLLL